MDDEDDDDVAGINFDDNVGVGFYEDDDESDDDDDDDDYDGQQGRPICVRGEA